MAGKKVYMGEIMQSVVDALQPMVSEMQEVVENTKYIKNLYDAVDLRGSATYSAANNTLIARVQAANFGYTLTPGTYATMTYDIDRIKHSFSKTDNSGSYVASFAKTIDFTDVDHIKLKHKGTITYGSTSNIPTRRILVGALTETLTMDGTEREIIFDTSAIGSALFKYDMSCNGYCTYSNEVWDIKAYDANDQIIGDLLPAVSYKNVGNAIGINDSKTLGGCILIAPSPVDPVSKWDLFDYLVSDGTCKVSIINADGLYIAENVEAGYFLGNVKSTSFLTSIRLERALSTDPNVLFSSAAYRYIK